MRAEYDKRRLRSLEILRTIPKLSCTTPLGAFYILVDISKTGLGSEDFAEQLLTKEKVAVVPGSAFGDDSLIRISYATGMENIERGLGRLANFCASIV
jgi:aspartate aminotransferase